MSYNYYLPDERNSPFEHQSESNSIIIIGANGSGKSRLGAWIEKQNIDKVHRIGAQRDLELTEHINLKSYTAATNLLLTGLESPQPHTLHNNRWGYAAGVYKYETGTLRDYEHALSALIAKQSLEQSEYVERCRQKEKVQQPHDRVPTFVFDKLKTIWNKVYPHRQIDIIDAQVKIFFDNSDDKTEYLGKNMSDGERGVLYLLSQCLSIPKDKIIIVDEPEIHIHRSIMNHLWVEIENERPDCLFIYITHDTQFASNHKHSQKIWVKNFNGTRWSYQFVSESDLPEQLLLDILGNRKKVLFVEGTADSYDTKLYSEIYQDYYVVPCGGCSSVIQQTKSMRNTQQLNHIECFGIIDRDFRSDEEIASYKRHGIFTLGVAEVENLFLVEEVLIAVNTLEEFSDESRVEQIKDYIINQRFIAQINRQVCEAVVSELKYKLSTIEISKNNDAQAKLDLLTAYSSIKYENIENEINNKFQEAKESNNYTTILSIFNYKNLSASVGNYFGIQNNEYRRYILRKIVGPNKNKIIEAIIPYLPPEIPLK